MRPITFRESGRYTKATTGREGSGEMRVRDVGVEAGHLIRLAGELHDLGVDSVVRLPPHHEPAMEIPLYDPGSRLRVTAVRRGRTWMFIWGRSRRRRVPTSTPEAAQRVVAAAQAARAAHEARLAATAETVRVARAAEVLSDRDDVSGAPGVRVLWRAR
ncbi:hypothetical protein [Sphaerimonospora thailandensis]|uniref:Uncharacterized protein n=1 Tax=Sphaerimonospora thailandensis TaxID=795644 RepID=A0A8J3RB18_9ACTN|nr:hypothetical protein [Sphaerimonospora thailandensis]GIH71280.1 hypothetical protein Mth01_35330 [Sphaerimonospora thailandensis]